MLIQEALSKLDQYKRLYFMIKNGIDGQKVKYSEMTIDDFIQKYLKPIHRNIDSFRRWEQTEEYKQLIAIMLLGQSGNDLKEIYDSVTAKAKQGDKSAVEMFFKLQKELKQIIKNEKVNDGPEQQEQQEDELMLE
jgi:predicted secreted protein